MKHAVGAANAVDRVDENRPDGREGHDETVRGVPRPKKQDRQRDERDGRNRAQELDHDDGVEQRAGAADQKPTATPTTIAIASPSA